MKYWKMQSLIKSWKYHHNLNVKGMVWNIDE
nr:MAG TPA: hypothetical protein [Caudoviricetes sp.]